MATKVPDTDAEKWEGHILNSVCKVFLVRLGRLDRLDTVVQFMRRESWWDAGDRDGALSKLLGLDERVSLGRTLKLFAGASIRFKQGWGGWVSRLDPTLILCWPAAELLADEEPELIKWSRRWVEAGGPLYQNGRMIAPFDSTIWQKVSYFGLPFPPFDLGGNERVEDVTHEDALRLRVVRDYKETTRFDFDFDFEAKLSARLEHILSPEGVCEPIEAMRPGDAVSEIETIVNEQEVSVDLFSRFEQLLEELLPRLSSRDSALSAYRTLGTIHRHLGRDEKERDCQTKIVELLEMEIKDGLPRDQLSSAYRSIASIHEELGDPGSAARFQALAEEEVDGFTILHRVEARLRSHGMPNSIEDANPILQMITKVIERVPEKYVNCHSKAYRLTGEILESIGELRSALEYFQCALGLDPRVGCARKAEFLRKQLETPSSADSQ
jgi:tetratricopeptide (TPR) repeat protein